MALITKGGTKQIRTNFNEHELRSRSWEKGFLDAPESFELSDITLDGMQIIRNYYNVPMIPSSTLRSDLHNSLTPGASSGSFHKLKNGKVHAVDWEFEDQDIEGSEGYNASIDYYNQMKNKSGALYSQLKAIGVNGIGLYDNFNHTDSRSYTAFWDNSTKKKSYIEAITSTYSNNEDGYIDWSNSIITTSIIIVVLIVLLIWWFKFKK